MEWRDANRQLLRPLSLWRQPGGQLQGELSLPILHEPAIIDTIRVADGVV